MVGRVVVIAVTVAGVVADIRVFVLFVSRGFYTRDSRSLIALRD